MKTPAQMMTDHHWTEFSDIEKIKKMAAELNWSLARFQQVITRIDAIKKKGIL